MWYSLRKWIVSSTVQTSLFAIVGSIIIVSLIDYNPNDPSFNNVTHSPPTNILQYFGSYLADLLYSLLGFTAFLIPLIFFVWSIQICINKDLSWLKVKFILLLLSCIGFSTILADYKLPWLPSSCGGGIGVLIYELVNTSNYSLIINTTIFFSSIICFFLSTGFSFYLYLDLVKLLGRFLYLIAKFILSKKEKQSDYRLTRPIVTLEKKEEQLVIRDKQTNVTPQNIKQQSHTHTQPNQAPSQKNILPSTDLLQPSSKQQIKLETNSELKQNAENLLKVLNDFGVRGKIIDVSQGPVVTLYEFEPAAGTKSSRVIGLSDDIARSLSAVSTRIATIAGRNALGVELPNKQRAFFCLRELIETPEYNDKSISLPLILGKDLAGKPYIADLAKMPHLLVAGTTGSGKSVAINAMIMSLLYRYTPAECRLIMIDPKMLELSVYDNIPHLLTPVVTEANKAIVALKWAVKEMENRYRSMSNIGVRNITGYNAKIIEAQETGKTLMRTAQTGFDLDSGEPIYESVPISMEKLPFIVVVVDEMADLMIVAGKDIESSIQRLAQMARAAGIHIIMATQRPSVDVITGVIKANFPSRISFKVTSKIDSRTILGEQGSEQLLGMGDMLYMGNASKIIRVHGPFVDDSEVEKVAEFLRSTGQPSYVSAVIQPADEDMEILPSTANGDNSDTLYQQAVQIIKLERKVSTSYIQRSLRIGYNRAADIVDKMERNGLISPPNHSGKREILISE